MRRTFVFVIVSAILTVGGIANAAVEPVNKSGKGVAIKGYDPVAYFKQSQPVMGSAQFSFKWMNTEWWFANAEDRDLFAADPAKYSPQFGGYCAYAVSKGQTANIDPAAWKIIDGRLYLNYSKGVQKTWEQGVDKRIEDANKNWPNLHK